MGRNGQVRLFLTTLALACLTVRADFIPADRMIPWVRGVTVGVRGGIPTRTNLVSILDYGGTTNRGTVTGTIALNSYTLTVSSQGDFAIGQSVYVTGAGIGTPWGGKCAIVTNIVGNTWSLNSPAYVGATNATVRHDNGLIVNWMDYQHVTAGDVIYVPKGRYLAYDGVVLRDVADITFRCESSTNALDQWVYCGSQSFAFEIGRDAVSQLDYWYVSQAQKGSTTITLYSNASQYGTTIVPNTVLRVSQLNGTDDVMRVWSTAGSEHIVGQAIHVDGVDGTNLTIAPPLSWSYTNQSVLTIKDHGPMGLSTRRVGIDGLNLTLTNVETGESVPSGGNGGAVFVTGSCDCFLTNCSITYCSGDHLKASSSVDLEIDRCYIAKIMELLHTQTGFDHALCSGTLLQNNVFDGCNWSYYVFGSTVGCAYFANLWTNCINRAVDMHASHDLMNLYEANVFNAEVEADGLTGSNSHQTWFRDRIMNISLMRWNTFMNIVSCVMGYTNLVLVSNGISTNDYAEEGYDCGAPLDFPMMNFGSPFIGGACAHTGTTPPISWNYPGDSFQTYTNLSYYITNTLVQTTNLTGDFSGWPLGSPNAYNLIFQDSVDTNFYHTLSQQLDPGLAHFENLYAVSISTTNMILSYPINVTNGWRMFSSCSYQYPQWQQDQTNNYILHALEWQTYDHPTAHWITNSTITDPSPASLLYTNGAPEWWGTNRWPAIDPYGTPFEAPIPAELWYVGISSGTLPTNQPPPTVNTNLTITSTPSWKVIF